MSPFYCSTVEYFTQVTLLCHTSVRIGPVINVVQLLAFSQVKETIMEGDYQLLQIKSLRRLTILNQRRLTLCEHLERLETKGSLQLGSTYLANQIIADARKNINEIAGFLRKYKSGPDRLNSLLTTVVDKLRYFYYTLLKYPYHEILDRMLRVDGRSLTEYDRAITLFESTAPGIVEALADQRNSIYQCSLLVTAYGDLQRALRTKYPRVI